MKAKERNKLGVSNNAEINGVGIPQILAATKVESLNCVFTLKLWPSVAKYITEGPGPEFVRASIIEKLERLVDQPKPARCSECANLTDYEGKDFCLVVLAFVGEKTLLTQPFSCEYFAPKKEKKK